MTEYMSVREAAAAWGIPERRVRKLCEDGKIDGLIRIGGERGIPRDAAVPAVGAARPHGGGKTGGKPAVLRVFENFIGPDARLSVRNGGVAVYHLENGTGSGVITIYDVFPGVTLFYNDLHLSKITGHEGAAKGGEDSIVIDHCREGRFECELKGGEYGHLGEGDLVVSETSTALNFSVFPLSHYHGISIFIDIAPASETVEAACALLRVGPIDLREIKRKLLSGRPYFLMRGTEAIDHIFSEIYDAPPALKESYIRLKLIELLLFLNASEPDGAGERRYFYKTRVDAVKAMRDYMTANLERQFTLPELSKLFGIPLTAMKSCFKTVFGTPVQEYMREYRIQAARVLLRESGEAVSAVAARVGYDSHAKFSAAFKARCGCTPSEYRKITVRKG
jgi:AraC-like DNA-binding protein